MSKENCEKYKNQIKDLNKKIGNYEERNEKLATELKLKEALLRDLEEGGISVETYNTIIDIYDRQSRTISASSIQLDNISKAVEAMGNLKKEKEVLEQKLKKKAWVLNRYTVGGFILLVLVLCIVFYVTPRFPVEIKISEWIQYSSSPHK